MKAIPTKYRGIQMRSRLEARYAWLFDRLGWNWEYEPVDLGSWVPDFVLTGVRPVPVYIDIKPIFEIEPNICSKIENALAPLAGKCEALVCGAALTKCYATEGDPPVLGIGWMWAPHNRPNRDKYRWMKTCLVHVEHSKWIFDLDYKFIDYIYESRRFSGIGSIKLIWAEAGNSVQWKAPR